MFRSCDMKLSHLSHIFYKSDITALFSRCNLAVIFL